MLCIFSVTSVAMVIQYHKYSITITWQGYLELSINLGKKGETSYACPLIIICQKRGGGVKIVCKLRM